MMHQTSALILGLILLSMCTAIAATDELDAYIISEMQSHKIPGAAIAIINHDRIMKRVYGSANLETDTPICADSVFEIASVTKPFTAAGVMLLVQEGKIHLNDPIDILIEHVPAAWKGSTVRHLLSHTSGLKGGGWIECNGSPLLDISTQLHFEDIVKSPLLFPPGEGATYSDSGYLLLGMIIERISGLRYRDFMQRRVFVPAGMTSTRILDRLEIVERHVSCYTLHDGRIEHNRRVWQHELPSYFGMLTTIDDMVRWDSALKKGMLLRPETLSDMWTPTKLKDGKIALVDGQPHGLGWFVGGINGHRIVGHPGFLGSVVFRFLDDRLTIIVLTNLDVASGSHQVKLALEMASCLRPNLAPVLAPYLESAGPGGRGARQS
jgi:D-alanyl-D-alanine carboxypeptidase